MDNFGPQPHHGYPRNPSSRVILEGRRCPSGFDLAIKAPVGHRTVMLIFHFHTFKPPQPMCFPSIVEGHMVKNFRNGKVTWNIFAEDFHADWLSFGRNFRHAQVNFCVGCVAIRACMIFTLKLSSLPRGDSGQNVRSVLADG